MITPINQCTATPHFNDDRQVDTYANNSDLQWGAAMQIFERNMIMGNESFIDFGCGDGKITNYLCERTTGMVLGFDNSKQMIEKASSTYQNSKLSFIQADITTYSSAQQWDVAYAGYCLHYVQAEEGLKRMFDALKPGGTALITLPGKYERSLASYSEILAGSEKWKSSFVDFSNRRRYYDREEFIALLQQVGFIPEHVEMIEQKVTFPDKAAIKNFYLPVSAYAKHLAEGRREEFINDLIEMVLTDNGSRDSAVPFVYQTTLEAIAQKPEEIK